MVSTRRSLSSFQILIWSLLLESSNAFIPPTNHNRKISSIVTKATSNQDELNNNNKHFLTNRRSILRNVATTLPFLLQNSASAATLPTPGGKIKYGDESIMSPKEHGTTSFAVQENLRYNVSRKLADKICCYNRHFAELGGYFESKSFDDTMRKLTLENDGDPVTFYDSVTGKPLFVAPINRSVEDFINESKVHGWPSFRDEEVVWENVRILRNSGETVSVDGTHLGHNLPDKRGNRYCINLVSIAGNPKDDGASSSV
uniref:Peptide-methionine (R)-S-oxide reductase n=1 Tax=Helicotheca tamesis TaxID=374047 RepID=A0A7S2MU60_9STRA